MAAERIYKCCICKKQIKNIDTIRLTKELYGLHYRGGHYPVEHYDFCPICYKKFNAWIVKYRKDDRDV